MALGLRFKVGILLAVVVTLPLSTVAVAAGAIDWMGPRPDLTPLMASLQLAGFCFAAVAATRPCDED